MKKTTTVRKHPRNTKSGRTDVKRHNRRFQPKLKRSKKILDPRMTASFEALASKGNREYGMTLDLDKGTNQRIIQQTESIVRGKTGQENADGDWKGRATVNVPDGTDIKIHTHPQHNDAGDKYNRPSGGDIYNLLYRSLNDGDLDEAYVIGPDKSWYRYYLDIKFDKKGEKLNLASEEQSLWQKIVPYTQKRFDTEVEKKYKEIVNEDARLSHLDSVDRKKYDVYTKRRDEATTKKEAKKWDRKQFNLFTSKKTKERKERLHVGGVKKRNERIEMITLQRAFKNWSKYLHEEWGVRVERVTKNKDKSISMTYIPDK